jgi:hypothetical protein
LAQDWSIDYESQGGDKGMSYTEISTWEFELKDGKYVVVCGVGALGFSLKLSKKLWFFRRKLLLINHYRSVESASYALKRHMDKFNDLAVSNKPFDIDIFKKENE